MEQMLERILRDTLALDDSVTLNESTALLGSLPEFDSMAIVTVLTTLEDVMDVTFDDDELDPEVFATFGSLLEFLKQRS